MIKIFNLYSSLLIAIIICLSNIIYIYAIDNPQNNINNTLVKVGKINSIVLDLSQWGTFDVKNISKYLLAGDWNISISNERPINFMTNFSMVSIKGENLHNHQFINFNALLHNSFKQTIFILFYLSDSYALKQVVQRCF